jgi:hypothetical protein
MGDHQVLHKLLVNVVIFILDHLLQVLDKFLQHFSQNV